MAPSSLMTEWNREVAPKTAETAASKEIEKHHLWWKLSVKYRWKCRIKSSGQLVLSSSLNFQFTFREEDARAQLLLAFDVSAKSTLENEPIQVVKVNTWTRDKACKTWDIWADSYEKKFIQAKLEKAVE